MINDDENKILQEKFNELVKATKEAVPDNSSKILKCLIVYKLGIHLEAIFAQEKTKSEITMKIQEEIDNLISVIHINGKLNMYADPNLPQVNNQVEDIEDYTQGLYGNLWVDFDSESYFNEAFKRLKTRFELNMVDTTWFKDKIALDSGCGGGRYSIALLKFGFEKVVGVDLSVQGIPDAQKRIQGTPAEQRVEFVRGNVLDLPFSENTFDFVFSNGVLHHTKDPMKGIRECYRVLKPGGKIWLYMWWGDGIINMYWNTSRAILNDIHPTYMKNLLVTMGLPPNRRFYFMDPWFVPIRETYTSSQLYQILQELGFININRLQRGFPNDACELSYQGGELGRFLYGEGDLRFLAEKPT